MQSQLSAHLNIYRTRLHWDFGQNSINSITWSKMSLIGVCIWCHSVSLNIIKVQDVELWTHKTKKELQISSWQKRHIPIWSQSTQCSWFSTVLCLRFADGNFSRPLFFDGGMATSVSSSFPLTAADVRFLALLQ